MEALVIVAVVVGWILCGLWSYGLHLAFFWKNYPILQNELGEWESCRRTALFFACLGPVAFGANVLVMIEGQGFMFKWSKPRG